MNAFVSMLCGINVSGQKKKKMVDLRALYESAIEQYFGYSVLVFMRDGDDFQLIIDSNPFTVDPKVDPAKLNVTFLYTRPAESQLSALLVPENETAEFSIGEGEQFLLCPDGYGKTRLSNNLFEWTLGVAATTRNWKTVNAREYICRE